MCSMVFLPNMYPSALSRPEPHTMYPKAPIKLKFIRVWNPPNLTTTFKFSVTTMSTALLYNILYCTADRMLRTLSASSVLGPACRQKPILTWPKSRLMSSGRELEAFSVFHFAFQWVGALQEAVHAMYPVHKGLHPLPMSGTPAACHSVFKLVITGAVISVSRLLRGFMAYFSGLAPVCWQNWTPGTLFLKQASLITSCALNLGKLGFWSAAMPEFPDQSRKATGSDVALIMSSCLLKSVLWCRRNTQEDPFQTWVGLCPGM